MRVNAEFVISAVKIEQLPEDGLPEIAFVGRSNVGKSSLINTLVGRNALARTSNTPGRTQTLNYYRITPHIASDRPFFIVDMPGYGYAAVNRYSRYQWGQLNEQYLSRRANLCGVIQLIDTRHPPQPLDIDMFEWLEEQQLNYHIVATKADKIKRSKANEALLQIAETLNADSRDISIFSAETGLGKDVLWAWIASVLDVR